ncbi:YggU-like protein [Xylariomycetidae sp. FL2044]|nr:YggU-like protein [Xylariomycetidae sp. FL2044]
MAHRQAISLINKSSAEFLQLRCHVKPGASKVREGVLAVKDETIELCVTAQAQDGKANKAVIDILSSILGISKSHLQITHGTKARDKTISITAASLQHRDKAESLDLVSAVRERLLSNKSA